MVELSENVVEALLEDDEFELEGEERRVSKVVTVGEEDSRILRIIDVAIALTVAAILFLLLT